MSRFPRPRFPGDFGSYLPSGRPFLPTNQPRHMQPRPPIPYRGPAQFSTGCPERQNQFPPPQFRPEAPLPNNPRFYRHPRPQYGPRGTPGPRFQGKSHQGARREGAGGIEAYYKHSMVEDPWIHLEAKMKDSS